MFCYCWTIAVAMTWANFLCGYLYAHSSLTTPLQFRLGKSCMHMHSIVLKEQYKKAPSDKLGKSGSSCLMMKLQNRMISQCLLVAVLVLSCVALNHDHENVLTYPSRVINTTTTQLGCRSDEQLETVISEVKQNIRSILHQVGKLMHVQGQCIV